MFGCWLSVPRIAPSSRMGGHRTSRVSGGPSGSGVFQQPANAQHNPRRANARYGMPPGAVRPPSGSCCCWAAPSLVAVRLWIAPLHAAPLETCLELGNVQLPPLRVIVRSRATSAKQNGAKWLLASVEHHKHEVVAASPSLIDDEPVGPGL